VPTSCQWTQQADAATPTAYSYGYDAGNQIISAVLKSTGAGATVLKQFAYGYDLAGNRTSEQIQSSAGASPAISSSSFNNANQLTSRSTSGGAVQFAGYLSKQGTVTVAGNPATVNHQTTNFVGYANVGLGTNIVQIIATDYTANKNSRTNYYQLVVTNNGVAETLTFDFNGNETSVVTATSTNTYTWDAANRMVSFTGPTNQSLFTYDGFGRRIQIIELQNGVPVSTNKFLWDGLALAEQRDSTGATVTKRFFGQGEQISGTNYFFTRDHLGSVREMVDSSGTIRARYDYDPYGRKTKISGSLDADFGYAGMYYHAVSGLNLTLYRAYDADLGRWLSRDPLAEQAGLNLYAYAANNPINHRDKFGLCPTDTTDDNSDFDNELWNELTAGLFDDEDYVSDDGTSSGANSDSGLWGTLKQLWNDKGSYDLTWSGGDVWGGYINLSYSPGSGSLNLSGGFGVGYGSGLSLTGNINNGDNQGWGTVSPSVAGGNGLVGGSLSAGYSQGGFYNSYGGGLGVDAGGSVAIITYSGEIYNFKK
jgi:RHS repeat-associated protein